MKIELHLHTSEVSSCGYISAVEAVRAYKEHGYDCIVVTDHFSPGFVDRCYLNGCDSLYESYLKGYLAAKEEGEKLGLTVLLGTEVCLLGANNDYLIYGVNEDMFRTDDILKLSPKELSEYCNANGMLLYQAHPFRNNMKIIKPDLLFGIEVHNGNPRHNSRNNVSELWADMHSLHKISGSDYHQTEDIGRGGIITDYEVKTIQDLITVLKNDNYSLIK